MRRPRVRVRPGPQLVRGPRAHRVGRLLALTRPIRALRLLRRPDMTADAWAELDRVMAGDTIATWNRHRQPGGEWDAIRALPIRTRRRLTAAGMMRRDGLMPDVAAERIIREVPGVGDLDAALAWWARTALAAIGERRRVIDADARHRYARRNGHGTHYALRSAQARAAGHRSVWAMRQARGWKSSRPVRRRPVAPSDWEAFPVPPL
jgi:hypothetical protein